MGLFRCSELYMDPEAKRQEYLAEQMIAAGYSKRQIKAALRERNESRHEFAARSLGASYGDIMDGICRPDVDEDVLNSINDDAMEGF